MLKLIINKGLFATEYLIPGIACRYNLDSIELSFYMVNLGFTGGYNIFLIFGFYLKIFIFNNRKLSRSWQSQLACERNDPVAYTYKPI